jgi:hypothetical protein
VTRAVIGLNDPAIFEFFQVIGDEVPGFFKNIEEFTDAVIPVEEHQDNPETKRVGKEFHEPVQFRDRRGAKHLFLDTELVFPVTPEGAVSRTAAGGCHGTGFGTGCKKGMFPGI